uniref:PsbI n=6 Tax=Perilla frutescens TaxID=48386 RepID=A0A1B0VAJ4_PERFH|nr:PsbI [Perilla frutescens]YP_009270896.1 PsbI [Perilla frutescens var. hirtella]AMR74180.1 PsbI [Perilla frutescens var. acuta]AMR74268.1 PsbI [Perilla frutescens f. crispidiscolor]AMR74356.1 PsbI [Perilla frutescens var. crispa]AMR74532.1 PsbI [Perilla frutescens var. frutescens]AMR74092.1 PsbI [Perilla frutescens]
MEDLFSFFLKKSSWRLCNAYSETLRLYRSDIFCFSLYLWIPI